MGGTTTLTAQEGRHSEGPADLRYLGDASRHNPEDLLVAALSAGHMLWYMHLCADSGVVVAAYEDSPRTIDRNARRRARG